MRNRCEGFPFYTTITKTKKEMREVDSCTQHMCDWIVSGAAAFDLATTVGMWAPSPPPEVQPTAAGSCGMVGTRAGWRQGEAGGRRLTPLPSLAFAASS